MKLSITKNKNFISDCKRYETFIKETKSLELEKLYKRFLSQAKNIDAISESFELISNGTRLSEERARLKNIRIELEKKIILLKEKTRQT
jgi:hypothetical protein